ncbi:MAG: hypothetical protein KGJ60_02090, partial [Verrucomicrobiota bacterium]|nr:hypothetical protein [Verrucomicrobiota bacterium]
HRRQVNSFSGWLDWASLDRPVSAYASRSWQVDEGLPDNLVQAITQTSDGFLWVGTRDGLALFDAASLSATTPGTRRRSGILPSRRCAPARTGRCGSASTATASSG